MYMEWTALTVGIIGEFASIAAAIFSYPLWRESRRMVVLRLNVHGVGDTSVLPLATNGPGQWQIVCGLALHNDGDREARNWRLRLSIRQAGMGISMSVQPPTIVRFPYPIGDRSVSEVLAEAPAESITSNAPVSLGTRCAFNFDGEPPFVETEYTLDADHFRTKKGLLRFEIEGPLVSSRNNFTSYPNTHIRRG
jgi:hypothetical protein